MHRFSPKKGFPAPGKKTLIEKLKARTASKLKEINSPITFTDLMVQTDTKEKSFGEKKLVRHHLAHLNRVARLSQRIDILADIAHQYHLHKNFTMTEEKILSAPHPLHLTLSFADKEKEKIRVDIDVLNTPSQPTTQKINHIKPGHENFVTRLFFKEFSCYPAKTPFSFSEMNELNTLLVNSGRQYQDNFHLILSSLPIAGDDKQIGNYVCYIQYQTNADPVLYWFAKSVTSNIDLKYDGYVLYDRIRDFTHSADLITGDFSQLVPLSTYMLGWTSHPGLSTCASFIITTQGGAIVRENLATCIDVSYRIPERTMKEQLSVMPYYTHENDFICHQVNYAITSNSYDLKNCPYLSANYITHADAVEGGIYKKEAMSKYALIVSEEKNSPIPSNFNFYSIDKDVFLMQASNNKSIILYNLPFGANCQIVFPAISYSSELLPKPIIKKIERANNFLFRQRLSFFKEPSASNIENAIRKKKAAIQKENNKENLQHYISSLHDYATIVHELIYPRLNTMILIRQMNKYINQLQTFLNFAKDAEIIEFFAWETIQTNLSRDYHQWITPDATQKGIEELRLLSKGDRGSPEPHREYQYCREIIASAVIANKLATGNLNLPSFVTRSHSCVFSSGFYKFCKTPEKRNPAKKQKELDIKYL